jgi:hypothetical protein
MIFPLFEKGLIEKHLIRPDGSGIDPPDVFERKAPLKPA